MVERLPHVGRYFAVVCLLTLAWPLTTFAASSVAAAKGAPADKLQALVSDTTAQVQLAYRQHPGERALRQEQIADVLKAWRAAAPSEANNELLATWLRAAMLSSMPGSREPLPIVPDFAMVSKSDGRPIESAAAKKPAVAPVAKPDVDPFRDDSDSKQD
jgi:hypothetical protein